GLDRSNDRDRPITVLTGWKRFSLAETRGERRLRTQVLFDSRRVIALDAVSDGHMRRSLYAVASAVLLCDLLLCVQYAYMSGASLRQISLSRPKLVFRLTFRRFRFNFCGFRLSRCAASFSRLLSFASLPVLPEL